MICKVHLPVLKLLQAHLKLTASAALKVNADPLQIWQGTRTGCTSLRAFFSCRKPASVDNQAETVRRIGDSPGNLDKPDITGKKEGAIKGRVTNGVQADIQVRAGNAVNAGSQVRPARQSPQEDCSHLLANQRDTKVFTSSDEFQHVP